MGEIKMTKEKNESGEMAKIEEEIKKKEEDWMEIELELEVLK